jgi:hypothetical protein
MGSRPRRTSPTEILATTSRRSSSITSTAGQHQSLGYGTQTSPGVWSLTYTVGLTAGDYTVYAQAMDNFGVFGEPAALTLQVF